MSAVTVVGRLAGGRAGGWVWNPAGADEQLALACKDLEAGRFGMASEVLAASRLDFEARSRRSALLASAAASLDAADHWVAEEPSNPDALLLAARTAVVRARQVAAGGRAGAQAARHALGLCVAAAAAHPADPTPWVAQLALADAAGNARLTIAEGRQVYEERHSGRGEADARARHATQQPWTRQLADALSGRYSAVPRREQPYWPAQRVADALGELLAQGPWDLMFEVWARDPLGREGYHWMLECLPVHDAHQFATLISMGTPRTAATQLLPLAASVAEYRWLSEKGPAAGPECAAGAVWLSQALHYTCLELYDGWFAAARRREGPPPLADCSLLAHGLFKVGETHFARQVIEAMKPFAWTYPWSVTGGDGAREFERIARRLGVSQPRTMSGWEYRERYG